MPNEVMTFLDKHNACEGGRQFAGKFKTLADLYDGIERGDWAVWMLNKAGKLDKPTAVKLACEFALRLLPIYEAEHNRTEPRKAIEAALAWLENQTEANRVAAAYAAYAAAAAYDAADAADAAYAAAAAYDAAAAADAADAAYVAHVAYAADAAERKAQADIVRRIVPNPWKELT